jgi:hypothetical protein
MAVDATKFLFEKSDRVIDISPADIMYAVETLSGGAGRFMSKSFNTIAAIGKGDTPESRSLPVIRRFYRKVPDEILENIQQSKELNTDTFRRYLQDSAMEDVQRRRKANDYLDKYKEMESERGKSLLEDEIYNEDPRIYESFERYRKKDELGLSRTERQIKAMRPAVRARWIIDQLKKLKTRDEQFKKLDELEEKRILTERTMEELNEIGFVFHTE